MPHEQGTTAPSHHRRLLASPILFSSSSNTKPGHWPPAFLGIAEQHVCAAPPAPRLNCAPADEPSAVPVQWARRPSPVRALRSRLYICCGLPQPRCTPRMRLLPIVVAATAARLVVPTAAATSAPRMHLLADPSLLDHSAAAGVEITLGPVTKAAENPLLQEDRPWEVAWLNTYPTVAYDHASGKYKMWYAPSVQADRLSLSLSLSLSLCVCVCVSVCLSVAYDSTVICIYLYTNRSSYNGLSSCPQGMYPQPSMCPHPGYPAAWRSASAHEQVGSL